MTKQKIHEETCHVCGFVCSANLLARHIKCKHGETEYLKFKEYLIERQNKIKELSHKNTLKNTKLTILNCAFCDFQTTNLLLLNKHIQKFHPEKMEEWQTSLKIKKEEHKKQCLKNSKTVRQCKFCNEVFPSRQIANHIKHKHGNDAYQEFKIDLENEKSLKKLEKQKQVVCPICKKTFDSIVMHLRFKHNLTMDEIHTKYKNLRKQKNCRKPLEIKCELCGKIFQYNNNYVLHLKQSHPDVYQEYSQKNVKYQHFTCAICGKQTNALYIHVIRFT